MKTLLLAAILAGTAAVPAFAQSTPWPTPNPAMRQEMQRVHTQMQQMHAQMRSQILASLTPAHRALLASIAGQLATAANPDFKGAAQRLDAALSSQEKQAILNAANSMHTRMRAMMQSMPSPQPGSRPMRPPGGMHRGTHRKHTPDPGRILLELAGGHGGPGGMMMHP